MIELNPLDVLGLRKMDRIPPHFFKTELREGEIFNHELEDWIKLRLKGRYSLRQIPSVDKDGKLKTPTYVGFEEEKELTYFMLACPNLRR
jgi:hypothetical protein